MSRFTNDQVIAILARKGFSIPENAPLAARVPDSLGERHSPQGPVPVHGAEEEGGGRVAVIITRYGTNRLDRDNLYAGVKPLVDCLRSTGRIRDDDAGSILLVVRQRKVPKADQGTEILIVIV